MIARKPRPQKDSGYHRRKMNDILEHMLKMADDSQAAQVELWFIEWNGYEREIESANKTRT